MKPEITLYVRSDKILAGEKLVEGLYSVKPRTPRAYEMSRDTTYEVKLKKVYNYVLPDDQKALIEDVKRLIERYGLEMKIIDVSQEDAYDPLILIQRVWRRIKGIHSLPVLETNRGEMLRAPFSQNELEEFVSKLASTID